ncbi:hypothetical protein DPMN_188588 [Dreissena polymorpha]|uniref:Uncharacterized protein n=1 Tax=Dreissena polymorpha TaxID=45954 RepID=A0A9D4DTA0_DREPO|nr:hypothetical protein DPMN_188588 [Dreissena polymorpha]
MVTGSIPTETDSRAISPSNHARRSQTRTEKGGFGLEDAGRRYPAEDHHLHQDLNHHLYMECPNHVRDQENSTRRRDEEVQPHHHSDQRIKMDWLWAEATDFR